MNEQQPHQGAQAAKRLANELERAIVEPREARLDLAAYLIEIAVEQLRRDARDSGAKGALPGRPATI